LVAIRHFSREEDVDDDVRECLMSKCLECRSKDDVEHVLMHCKKYRDERIRLKQKISKAGRKWNLKGLLGTTGDGVKDTQKAVIQFLKNIGIYKRI